MNERLANRIALIAAYNALMRVLGRLAVVHSGNAAALWSLLPDYAPVDSLASVARASHTAMQACPCMDAAPEWATYVQTLADFAHNPLYGPAPVPLLKGAIAAVALGNGGYVYRYPRGEKVSTRQARRVG